MPLRPSLHRAAKCKIDGLGHCLGHRQGPTVHRLKQVTRGVVKKGGLYKGCLSICAFIRLLKGRPMLEFQKKRESRNPPKKTENKKKWILVSFTLHIAPKYTLSKGSHRHLCDKSVVFGCFSERRGVPETCKKTL